MALNTGYRIYAKQKKDRALPGFSYVCSGTEQNDLIRKMHPLKNLAK